ncbi:beta-glucosidase-like SFR2, chloroplastic isoform X2 [Coffea arabica]|uniref:Beta-glucosidase-like SFR2, chloroplastic isoform X2 n=1 Tax=Coffea arabica TaxID=13443 RepID=A0ABM4X868_COFAR
MLLTLFVSATKLAGLLVTVTVAANAVSYRRFRNKNLMPIPSPIDEASDILAVFNINPSSSSSDDHEGEKGFFFGLATAPAHVEDRLNDAWLEFAEKSPCDKLEPQHNPLPADVLVGSASSDGGSQPASLPPKEANRTIKRKKPLKIAMEAKLRGFEKYEEFEEPVTPEECHHNVAAWHNVPNPEERLRFWSDPDTELKLAKDTGVQVFRMGIDWTRIMPEEPVTGLKETVNYAALERYRWIINRVRSYGMKVMLTLFHHSLPPWAGDYGGWKLEKTVDYFMQFTRLVVDSVSDIVDYWVTFNEPHVFCMLTYCAGAWPGGNPDMLEVATSALPTGVFNQAMHWITTAHLKAYDYIHEKSTISCAIVGVAHHVSFMRPYGLFDIPAVKVASSLTLFPFLDSICDKLDYIGINYYGQEVVSGTGLKLVETDEYSESGRGVYPDGLYRVLVQFHERYKHLKLPFVITENGVSDETDLIRHPYLLEHLLAVYAAMTMVVKSGKVTREDRERSWNGLQMAAKEKKTRPFYRAVNKRGLMYAGSLDQPIRRLYVERDWRFGHYEMEGLQDPLSRFSRYILQPFYNKRKAKSQADSGELVLEPLNLVA